MHAGGCRRVWRNRLAISGRSTVQLKSPISTACGVSASSSAMNDSCEARDCAPSDRWATAMVRPSSPSPNFATSTPRPAMRPGRECTAMSSGSNLLSRPLALEANWPTRRLGWWVQ